MRYGIRDVWSKLWHTVQASWMGRLRQRAWTRSRLSLSGCNHLFVPSLKARALVDTHTPNCGYSHSEHRFPAPVRKYVVNHCLAFGGYSAVCNCRPRAVADTLHYVMVVGILLFNLILFICAGKLY